VSSARALEHVRRLAVEIGSRPAGSEKEQRAADYIREELARYGYEASIQEFDFHQIVDAGTKVELLSPQQRELEARAFGGSENGSVEGELVFAGLGRVDDFPADVVGKIALIERGDIRFSMKVNNAAAAGAAGVLIYNNEPGIFGGELGERASIPAASISREDGQEVQSFGSPLAVRVRLTVLTEELTKTSRNVVATPADGSCEIVAGGHLDSVPEGPGANDNASGTAVVLEIARARAAEGALEGVCYVLFGAEELGLLGSAYYVDTLPAGALERLTAMLNFDMLSVGDGWPFVGDRLLTDLVKAEAAEAGVEARVLNELPENVGSDHFNFARNDIPSIIFNCFCDENYHTKDDRFEFVREDRLGVAAAIGAGVIEALLTD
jgi:aminopeptidase YwaD